MDYDLDDREIRTRFVNIYIYHADDGWAAQVYGHHAYEFDSYENAVNWAFLTAEEFISRSDMLVLDKRHKNKNRFGVFPQQKKEL